MSGVPFLDVAGMARWIRRDGAEQIIADIAAEVENDFRRWPQFDTTPRVATHSPEGVIELMPISDGHMYGFKYVNGHPLNPSRGFQTVTAFGMLADVMTGYPVFISEMTLLTALRTAATSAMAARHLAKPSSRTMALIGTGSQAEFQALGFRALLGIRSLRAWDTDPQALHKFVTHAVHLGFSVHVATSARDAVEGADIITTCTADKTNATVLTDDMVADGVHLNAIGGDCPGKTELDPQILHRSSVFVELTEQTRVEGEIQQVAADFPVTELWEVIAGRSVGRSSDFEVTVFDSVGFAIEDFAALRHAMRSVDALTPRLDLLAELVDPKDLFALVQPVRLT